MSNTDKYLDIRELSNNVRLYSKITRVTVRIAYRKLFSKT